MIQHLKPMCELSRENVDCGNFNVGEHGLNTQ